MIYDQVLWARFACAALTSGNVVTLAADRADLMLKEYKKRWCSSNPLTENNDDSSHRAY